MALATFVAIVVVSANGVLVSLAKIISEGVPCVLVVTAVSFVVTVSVVGDLVVLWVLF